MLNNTYKKIFGIIGIAILSFSFITSTPKEVEAVFGVGDVGFVTVIADTSPTSISRTFDTFMQKLKDFVLDRLATMIAKQILHQMTVSVINWINTGFQGSPSFLTNPEGFFLDAADQVSGAFLAQSGALSRLCSPFITDLRLVLALEQVQLSNTRYSCTLSRVIDNVNGSVEGFINGDFRQGGWRGFIELASAPQNTPGGAYLQAHSELLGLIANKKSSINADLTQGKGFLSWQSCKDVTNQINDPSQGEYFGDAYQKLSGGFVDQTLSLNTGNGTSIKRVYDKKTSDVSFQDCKTETPGSAISGMLEKNLNIPATELELANSINAILDALVGQMVNQIITGGVGALSRGGSGGSPAYTQQIITSITSSQNAQWQSVQRTYGNALSLTTGNIDDYKNIYDQAVFAVASSKAQYQTARACIIQKVSNVTSNQLTQTQISYFQSYVNNIDSILASRVDPLLATLTAKQTDANTRLLQIRGNEQGATSTPRTPEELQQSLYNLENGFKENMALSTTNTIDMSAANNDLTNAKQQANLFEQNALQYQSACNAFPTTVTFVPYLTQ